MADNGKSEVIIRPVGADLQQTVDDMMAGLVPNTFGGATVLIKPNMVGPSAPELGHTTNPELVRAVVRSCLDRNARVMVGDNPGGMNRNSRNVAQKTGILDASEGCFTPISHRVVEKSGVETGFPLVVSQAVLDADYIINLPKFKTHLLMMVSGALKNAYGYVAGACKARLHVQAAKPEIFAKVICDIHEVRPPDLHIMDAITVIEGNGPCHGGHLREVGKLLASADPLALDWAMARMTGADPDTLPAQKQAQARELGSYTEDSINVIGELSPIPDFRMPVTYQTQTLGEEELKELGKLYPRRMMQTRITIKPQRDEDKCIMCEDCALNCPARALTLEPDFNISDECIACFCCVELCPEGALEVPDVEAFRHY
jgi:uncharacterized protein (DUF362 family)/NAD-dependent dihydropyrimidine dehydrogenase PreA subunit